MIKFWIITASVFIILTVVIAKYSYKHVRKESSEKMWKIGNGRAVYWVGVAVTSSALTILLMSLLHFTNIISF